MISLSRLIKSQWANAAQTEQRVIGIKMVDLPRVEGQEELYLAESFENDMLSKARTQADMMMQEAAIHVQSLREQIAVEQDNWEQKKRELEEQARESGFQLGLEEGRVAGHKDFEDIITMAKQVVEQSKEDYQKQIEKAEKTILELGIKTAASILGKKVVEKEEDFFLIVKRALKEARDYREVQLHVNPVHYGFLLSQKDELIALFPKELDFYIYPDEELSEMDCIIESANGRIDASIDSQLEEIKNKLIELLESEGA
ncbi:flagellar assembly protein FliH [Neobacillus sp. PS3-34]|uniref:flagellar assembly protein FliH n=1 Tax=Neobacillus sp. PS3-34 TaxID=3070678 RepID=UPI0027E140DE|nr:flagellar assembly protein FliH [Neobacillus sp. PS3-34]WML49282.1 flagellar assembly protein FliH [Neobacillus sp. PS3-34]